MSRPARLAAVAALLLASGPALAEELKGKVKSIAVKASVLSLAVEGQGVVLVRWDPATVLVNAKEAREIRPDELVIVDLAAAGAPARRITRVVAKVPEGIKSLKTEEVAAVVGRPGARTVIVDSRPASRFAEGHIPGAVNIPWAELEKQGPALLPQDRSTPLAFYCGGITCVMSPRSPSVAKEAGFTDVAAYPEGEPGWKRSDRLLESTVEFARTGNAVVVDLRPAAEAARGHLPRAVGIPASSLAGQEKAFPAWKGAPIVLYGVSPEALAQAAETLRDWDYTAVTALGGGLEAWKAAGLPLEVGPLPTTILFERRVGPNEVAIADFERALKDGSALMVDVRTAEEFGRGHLPGAINVPAEEFARRAPELPRGKPVLVYCGTGARAEMAVDAVKDRGLAVRYLKAAVEFTAGGTWAIVE